MNATIMEEWLVKKVLSGLHTYLHNNLRIDKDFIAGMSAAGLLGDRVADRLCSSVTQGGNKALYDLLHYMDRFYTVEMLEKFCGVLMERSMRAKPRLGEIANRIHEEMEKHRPVPTLRSYPRQQHGVPTATRDVSEETQSGPSILDVSEETQSPVMAILRGLRTYLHNNLKIDKSFISSLYGAGLLSDSDTDFLQWSVSQGGHEALYGVLQYMEWYYNEQMLEKFCVFLDHYSKPARPRLGKIAKRIREEMEKHQPVPIHQHDPPQQQDGVPRPTATDVSKETQSPVMEILRGLRAYLHKNLRIDEDFISGLSAAGLLSDSDADGLRSSVTQGGNEALYDLLHYIEWFYEEEMLEKFCVFLDDYSKLAKPRLGEVAERIRQEMKKHQPGPIHQPDPQQRDDVPGPTATRDSSHETQSGPSWMTQYKKAMIERQGSVSLNIIRCVLVGPPKVGKSCLKHLLVHNEPKEVTTSTLLLESPEIVTFTPNVVTFTPELYMTNQGSSSVWQPIKDMGGIVKKWTMEEQYETQETQPTTGMNQEAQFTSSGMNQGEPESRHHPSQKSILTDKVSDDLKPTLKTTATVPVSSHERFTALQEAHEHLHKDLEKGNLAHALDQGELTLIHILDSGGQPAFQDTLPLLIGTPCTYVTVFNAAVDLDQPVDITYRAQDGSEAKLDHQLSQWDIMLRTFSSVHTMEYKCHEGIRQILQDGSTLPHSRIAVVGTHKDQLEALPNRDDLKKKIVNCLGDIEESKPYFLIHDHVNRLYFLTDTLKEINQVHMNSLRETLASKECALPLKVPLMWLMVELTTRRIPDWKFIPYNELKRFCQQVKYTTEGDVDAQFHSLLMFLHNLGFYAFYELEGFSEADNWVCTDAATLYREVSKLLVVQYIERPTREATQLLKSTGIIVVGQHSELFDEIDLLPTIDHSWFFAVLQYIGIAAECIHKNSRSSSSKELFFPLALPFNRATPPRQTSVANLCFTLCFTEKSRAFFECCDLPRGIFPRLVVHLADRKRKPTPWRLSPHKSDRTNIKFLHNNSTIFLRERPGHLEVAILLQKAFFNSYEVSPPAQAAIKLCGFCSSISDAVRTALENTCQEVFGESFSNTAIIRTGFPCFCLGESSSHLALVENEDRKTEINSSLCVRRDPEYEQLIPQQQVWFTSEYLYNYQFTVDESGKYWVMGEAETTLSSRKVSNQQDSQEAPSDVVQHKHSVARMSHSTSQTSTCVGDTSLEESVQSVIRGDTSQRKRPAVGGDTSQHKQPFIIRDTSQQEQTDAITLDPCLKESIQFNQETFMEKYKDWFMKHVPADAVVYQWHIQRIIDENTRDEVKKAPPTDKKAILFEYIRKNGSLHTIRKMSDFLIETGEHGYPHVKSLGEDMREDLKKYS